MPALEHDEEVKLEPEETITKRMKVKRKKQEQI